jgi:hypothetical protein
LTIALGATGTASGMRSTMESVEQRTRNGDAPDSSVHARHA